MVKSNVLRIYTVQYGYFVCTVLINADELHNNLNIKFPYFLVI